MSSIIESEAQFQELTGIGVQIILDTLERAASAANRVTMPLFRSPLSVENKLSSGFDPVTEADKNAETVIREIIQNAFPDHGIIGEEQANTNEDSPFSWIIDPVDGTRAFISGVPLWGTLIGFAYQGRVHAGIMSQPFTGETFVGSPTGAFWRQSGPRQSITTSGLTELAGARVFSTAPELFDNPQREAAWARMRAATLQTRYGCDCYAYCLVAAGHADIVMEPKMNIYDIAALIPIIEHAGGAVSLWDGSPADKGGDILAAATPELLDKALKLIAG